MLATTKPFRVLFCVQSPVLFCVFHSPSVSCFTEPFLFSVSYFSFSLVFPCCLVVWFMTFCLWPDYLSALPSGYCLLIVDHARLLDYSSAWPHLYLFAICSTLTVFLTMSSNKSLQMDLHASRLVGPVIETTYFLVITTYFSRNNDICHKNDTFSVIIDIW